MPDWLRDLSGARIAVVGADGFIGSHVVRFALRAGASVAAVHFREPWRLADLDDECLDLVFASRDELGRIVAMPALGRVDAVVWLAYVPPSGQDAVAHEQQVNTAGARRAIELGAPVVFASTADVYGPWHAHAADESLPPAPTTAYAIAKLDAEEALREVGVMLRIATVFGPGENGRRAIPSFTRALLSGRPLDVDGDGSDTRDYVHVADVASAIVNAAAVPTPLILNVGSGCGRSTLDIAAAVAQAIGVEPSVEYRASSREPSRLVLDVRRARSSLGFEPCVDFSKLLAEEVGWLSEFLSENTPPRT